MAAVYGFMQRVAAAGRGAFDVVPVEQVYGLKYEAVPIDEYHYRIYVHMLTDVEGMMLMQMSANMWRPSRLFDDPLWERSIQSERSL